MDVPEPVSSMQDPKADPTEKPSSPAKGHGELDSGEIGPKFQTIRETLRVYLSVEHPLCLFLSCHKWRVKHSWYPKAHDQVREASSLLGTT